MIDKLTLIIGIIGLIVTIMQIIIGLKDLKSRVIFSLSISTVIVCVCVAVFSYGNTEPPHSTPSNSHLLPVNESEVLTSSTALDSNLNLSDNHSDINTNPIETNTPTVTSTTMTTESNETTTSPTPVITESSEITDNYLHIEINGEKKKYFIRGNVELRNTDGLNKWYLDFYSNKFNNNDSISISLPANIAKGDALEAKPYNAMGNDGWLNMPDSTWGFSYTTENGNLYFIDKASGGKISVEISKWDGRGGYAEGIIYGEFILNEVDKITFKNGEFKAPIANESY